MDSEGRGRCLSTPAVQLNPEELKKVVEEGLEMRREVERRTARMTRKGQESLNMVDIIQRLRELRQSSQSSVVTGIELTPSDDRPVVEHPIESWSQK